MRIVRALADNRPALIGPVSILLLLGSVWWFVDHSIHRGLAISETAEIEASRLHHATAPLSNIAIYGHMIAGGVLTLLVPFQLLSPIRSRFPRLHHVIGYAAAIAACLTATGGFYYILDKGSVGGPIMDFGFGLYGYLLLIATFRTIETARARRPSHPEWALRFIVLALGSWIYRVHFALWEALTGGLGMTASFTGPADRIQVFAFYIPYLLLLEIWLWRRGRQGRAAGARSVSARPAFRGKDRPAL